MSSFAKRPYRHYYIAIIAFICIAASGCEMIDMETFEEPTADSTKINATDELPSEFIKTAEITPMATPEATETPLVIYEAEDAELKGLSVYSAGENNISIASGDKYVGNFKGKKKKLTFTVVVGKSGYYELLFYTAAVDSESYNNIVVNDRSYYEALYTEDDEFEEYSFLAYLEEGENIISLSPEWGGIYIDCLIVGASTEISNDIYDVPPILSNTNASQNTKRLMTYLTDIYGEYTLLGIYNYDKGVNCAEIEKLFELTGKYPAVIGFDFMDYSPSRVEHGAETKQADYAMEWGQMGGIVTVIWHWNAPKDLVDTKDQPWYRGFYTEATTFDLENALNGEDEEGYNLLLRDIDAIAEVLKPFAQKDIPILWRPLHEASGGWFWWGAYGSENYIKLWRLLYDRLTYTHGLNNLIWISNSENPQWYPGDDYCDILAADFYSEAYNYESRGNLFYNLLSYTENNKLLALAETGTYIDPDLMQKDSSIWLFYALWNGEFILTEDRNELSSAYNSIEMTEYIFSNEKIITYNELPDISLYPTE